MKNKIKIGIFAAVMIIAAVIIEKQNPTIKVAQDEAKALKAMSQKEIKKALKYGYILTIEDGERVIITDPETSEIIHIESLKSGSKLSEAIITDNQ